MQGEFLKEFQISIKLFYMHIATLKKGVNTDYGITIPARKRYVTQGYQKSDIMQSLGVFFFYFSCCCGDIKITIPLYVVKCM